MQWWCAAQGVPWTWAWQAYPGVWVFVLALASGFRALRGRFPEEDRPRFRAWMYGLGVLALWIALDWPVGALGAGYLASVHMVQYLLIALVAPPLLLVGMPRGMYTALVGGPLGRVVGLLSHPLVSMTVFVSIMAWTHWPPVVDVLMVTQSGSFLLDLLWLFSGLVFWWPVAAPEPTRSWLPEPAKVGYLIVATLVNTGVFAYLTFSPLPLYATYELAPPVTGLSTRNDQLLAGLLMKMGGAVVLWTAISVIFFRWYRRSEEAERSSRGAVAILLLTAGMAVAGCSGDGSAAVGDTTGGDAGLEAREGGELSAGVIVSDAVLAVPVTPGLGAVYLTLRNGTAEAVRIVSGTVSVHGESLPVEFHESSTQGGMMRMTPLDGLEVAPGAGLTLEPGGIHLMIRGLPETLAAGGAMTVELVDAHGTVIGPTSVEVVTLADLDAAIEGRSAGR